MSRTKHYLTMMALVALSGVSVMAVVQVVRTEPPDWSGVDHAELRNRLATEDVSEASPAERQKLIWRLEQDFRNGGAETWSSDLRGLPPAQRQRLLDNFDQLAKLWLTTKVEAWWSHKEKDRDRYLDREMENMLAWRLAIPDSATLSTSRDPAESISQLLKRVETWQRQATPAERNRTQKFIAALQRRWLQRQLLRMLPGGGEREESAP